MYSLFLLVLVACCWPIEGQLYVESSGANNVTCGLSLSTPCLSLQYAIGTRAGDFDSIYVGSGDFEGANMGTVLLDGLTIRGKPDGSTRLFCSALGIIVRLAANKKLTVSNLRVESTACLSIVELEANAHLVAFNVSIFGGNAGNGAFVSVPAKSNATVELTHVSIQDLRGPVVSTGGLLQMNNTLVSHVMAPQEDLFTVEGALARIELFDTRFQHNHARAVFQINGAVPMVYVDNSVFLNNSCTGGAGCLFIAPELPNARFKQSCFLATRTRRDGSVLHLGSGKVTIENCHFADNSVFAGDGGVFFIDGDGGSLAVTMSTFLRNSASDRSSDRGGVLYAYPNNGTTIALNFTRCIFTNNSAGAQGGSGGVFFLKPPTSVLFPDRIIDAVIQNCVFEGNLADIGAVIYGSSRGSLAFADVVMERNGVGNSYAVVVADTTFPGPVYTVSTQGHFFLQGNSGGVDVENDRDTFRILQLDSLSTHISCNTNDIRCANQTDIRLNVAQAVLCSPGCLVNGQACTSISSSCESKATPLVVSLPVLKECLELATHESSTSSPTGAPTSSPTGAPTLSPTNAGSVITGTVNGNSSAMGPQVIQDVVAFAPSAVLTVNGSLTITSMGTLQVTDASSSPVIVSEGTVTLAGTLELVLSGQPQAGQVTIIEAQSIQGQFSSISISAPAARSCEQITATPSPLSTPSAFLVQIVVDDRSCNGAPLSLGAIIGLTLGVVAVVAVLLSVMALLVRRRNSKLAKAHAKQLDMKQTGL